MECFQVRITLSIHVIVQIFIRIARLAAAAGAVFASPNPAQVRRAIDLVPSDKGCVSAIYTILVLTANLVTSTVIIVKCVVSRISSSIS